MFYINNNIKNINNLSCFLCYSNNNSSTWVPSMQIPSTIKTRWNIDIFNQQIQIIFFDNQITSSRGCHFKIFVT